MGPKSVSASACRDIVDARVRSLETEILAVTGDEVGDRIPGRLRTEGFQRVDGGHAPHAACDLPRQPVVTSGEEIAESARQQASGRTGLMSQLFNQAQDVVTIVSFGAGLFVYAPWLLVLMAVALVPFLIWLFYVAHLLLAGYVNLKLIFGGAIVTLGIAAIYYPACLATVAVWDNALAAISPAYVARVIRIIGPDYFIVIAMWFIASIITGVANRSMIRIGIPAQ